MKYIKLFEQSSKFVENKIFEKKCKIWVVPLKMPDFIISLKKIGIDDKNINDWMRLYKNNVFTEYGKYPDRETITIKKEGNGFTWYWYPSTEGNEYTDFMGKLEYTPEEIQDYYYQIELEKAVKKYNL
jgi:hypothetical protein